MTKTVSAPEKISAAYVVDVGSSSTKSKYFRNDGKESFSEVSNFVATYDGYSRIDDFIDSKDTFENKLDLTIKISPKATTSKFQSQFNRIIRTINNSRWLVGKLATIASDSHSQMVTGVNKIYQHHTYINVIAGLIVQMQSRGIYKDTCLVGMLVPPGEYFLHERDLLLDVFVGEITVTNHITNEIFSIVIPSNGHLIVKPESLVALPTLFVDDDGEYTPEGEELSQLFVLANDLGDNTLDYAALRNGGPLRNSLKSFPYATRVLLNNFLLEEIARAFDGYRPSLDELKNIFTKGTITFGTEVISASNVISTANEKFAKKQFPDFTTYLAEKGFNIKEIGAIGFVGGGNTAPIGTTPVGDYLIELINIQSPHTKALYPKNPRLANLNGLTLVVRDELYQHWGG